MGMRLGLLGPGWSDVEAFERAARGLRDKLGADRVVYLGEDGMLDAIVQGWAVDLVGQPADDVSFYLRATDSCLNAGSDAIMDFLTQERERDRLRMFESLAKGARSVEMIAGRVAILVSDKRLLSEEDILPAHLLLYGRSSEYVMKPIGKRWFLSPGSFPEAGVMMLGEEGEALVARAYSPALELIKEEPIAMESSLKMRAQGGS
jgi:hypothetical protein